MWVRLVPQRKQQHIAMCYVMDHGVGTGRGRPFVGHLRPQFAVPFPRIAQNCLVCATEKDGAMSRRVVAHDVLAASWRPHIRRLDPDRAVPFPSILTAAFGVPTCDVRYTDAAA